MRAPPGTRMLSLGVLLGADSGVSANMSGELSKVLPTLSPLPPATRSIQEHPGVEGGPPQ